jgi:SpoIID/LytB domain protein
VEVLGTDLRRVLPRLPSTRFEVVGRAGRFTFVGSGHGHGVGMSQWGARAMAERGADYREILAFFYRAPRCARVGSPRETPMSVAIPPRLRGRLDPMFIP